MIAESNYKSDEIDAELLARRRLAGLIPEVHPKASEQREQAVLLRNRARLVRERTWMVNRIHAHIHNVGLHLERGRLLTEGVACPPAAVPAGKAEEHNSLWPAVQSIPNGLDVIRPCPMTETDNFGSGWMADSQERRAKPTTPTPVERRREGDMIHDVLLTTTDATGGPPSVVMPE